MSKKNDDGQEINPSEQKLRDLTATMARIVEGHTGGIGFALFLFEFGRDGFTSYASNANRDDMRRALIEHLVRTETYAERMARLEKKSR